MLETLIISCIIIAVPLKLTNRPLSTYCHTLLIDNGFGSRQRLLCRLHFRLPSKVHSAILFIQQSHHLLLSEMLMKSLLLFLNGLRIYTQFSTNLLICQYIFNFLLPVVILLQKSPLLHHQFPQMFCVLSQCLLQSHFLSG